MSAEQPNKRRRASELGLLGAGSPLLPGWQSDFADEPAGRAEAEGSPAEPRPDVFEFLSQRSQKHRELEGLVQELQQREGELSRRLQEAQRQVTRFKVGEECPDRRQ
jgi:hypothetical protein